MKFEIDKRTGQMVPKKDDSIYFAKSMSSGLRVDDRKNNVKYVIERDGRLTNIFNFRTTQLYDTHDARILAQRVTMMFGPDHEYADYTKFTKRG